MPEADHCLDGSGDRQVSQTIIIIKQQQQQTRSEYF